MSGTRKVAFIGSSSFSGSTAMDLIVGTSEGAISLGEIGKVFYPRREIHSQRECGCMNPSCKFWDGILGRSEKGVHLRVFENHDATLLSDSTKDPFWIKSRSEELEENGIEVINILLWRHPDKVRASFEKRGRVWAWEKAWVTYYRLYFALIDRFIVIPFESIHSEDGELERRLEIAGISGVSKEFWMGETHSLFGNSTAKKSFFPIDSTQYSTLLERQKKSANSEGEHREIFLGDGGDNPLETMPTAVKEIFEFLEGNDIILTKGTPVEAPRNMKMGKIRRLASLLFYKFPSLAMSRRSLQEFTNRPRA